MFPTAEVRWFRRGAVPPEVWEWFYEQGHEPEEQPPRVDYYLRLVDGDSLGIKLREGKIEVKQRHSQHDVAHFGKRTVGRMEHWRKWSFELAGTSGVVAGLGVFSSWIGVRKERKLRTYRATDDGTVIEVPAGGNLSRGCGWEVAKVSVEGTEEEWWSLGFEAFGRETELRDSLLLVAEHILSAEGAPVLGEKDSCSYPRWLQVVGG